MTNSINADFATRNSGNSLSLGFESSEAALMAGIRVRPADLARLFGVSKQAVSSWVKDGRVILGVDGRVDPRAAITRLLSTGDPARLRAFFLKPVIADLTAAQRRAAELEKALAVARDSAEFNEASASEFSRLFATLEIRLELEWAELRKLPAERGLAALLTWLNVSLERGVDPGLSILDIAARVQKKRGEGAGHE